MKSLLYYLLALYVGLGIMATLVFDRFDRQRLEINMTYLAKTADIYLQAQVSTDSYYSRLRLTSGIEWTEKIPFSFAKILKKRELKRITEKDIKGRRLTKYERSRLQFSLKNQQVMDELGSTMGAVLFDHFVTIAPYLLEILLVIILRKVIAKKEIIRGQEIEVAMNANHKEIPSADTKPKRPRSLAIVSLIFVIFFGLSYLFGITMLVTQNGGEMLSRMFVEPPEGEGGIAFPGWDAIADSMRGESAPLEQTIAAQYWFEKIKLRGSYLVGPVFIIGWLGVYRGRQWGRILLYVYAASWLANKVIYLLLLGPEGVFKFSLAVGMAVLLVLVLRCKSWSRWIENSSQPTQPYGGSAGASPPPVS